MAPASAYLVDADREARLRLHRLLDSRGVQGRPFVSGNDFLEELPHLSAGVVMIDIGNAGGNGFDVIEAIARSALAFPVIAMTAAADVHIAVAAIRRGATDFLVKPINEDELDAALGGTLAILARRQEVFHQVQADEAMLGRLTARENAVLELVAEGLGNKEIAGRLQIGVRTVEAYRAGIAQKLNVANSAAAVALFARHRSAMQAHAARILVSAGA